MNFFPVQFRLIIALFLVTLAGSQLAAQSAFKPGYFITLDGNHIFCLINDLDKIVTPEKFSYKLTETDSVHTHTATSVREFGIGDSTRFIARQVKMDLANYQNVSPTSTTVVVYDKTLFLKVLVEGKASLYYYQEADFYRFFYSIDTIQMEQLVFFKYQKPNVGNAMVYYNKFRDQLWVNVRCATAERKDVESLRYNKKDFIKYFVNYNICSNSEYYLSESVLSPGKTTLHISPEIGSELNRGAFESIYQPLTFSPWTTSFRPGIDLELVLPRTHGKNALLLNPKLSHYTTDPTINGTPISIDYIALLTPFGYRRYFYKSNSFNIYANFVMTMNFHFKLRKEAYYLTAPLEANRNTTFGAGIGASYKRIGVEMRANSPANLIPKYRSYYYKITTLEFILKCRII